MKWNHLLENPLLLHNTNSSRPDFTRSVRQPKIQPSKGQTILYDCSLGSRKKETIFQKIFNQQLLLHPKWLVRGMLVKLTHTIVKTVISQLMTCSESAKCWIKNINEIHYSCRERKTFYISSFWYIQLFGWEFKYHQY